MIKIDIDDLQMVLSQLTYVSSDHLNQFICDCVYVDDDGELIIAKQVNGCWYISSNAKAYL